MNQDLKQTYSAFIHEFLSLGQWRLSQTKKLELVTTILINCHITAFPRKTAVLPSYVLSLDASAKTSSGVSLNKRLILGPKLQSDLFHTILRLRLHAVAFSADMAKMYRQVALDEPDRDYHRLLWREETNELLQYLRITRVTYGIASSCCHSIKCLMVLAKTAWPGVRRIIETCLWMIYSQEQIRLKRHSQYKELIELLHWNSNNLDLIKALPPDYRESEDELVFGAKSYQIQASGNSWQPVTITFHFKIDTDKTSEAKTKRQVVRNDSFI